MVSRQYRPKPLDSELAWVERFNGKLFGRHCSDSAGCSQAVRLTALVPISAPQSICRSKKNIFEPRLQSCNVNSYFV